MGVMVWLTRMRQVACAIATVLIVAASGGLRPTPAIAISVVPATSKLRNVAVPLIAANQPVRQRRIRDGYKRLLRIAESICRAGRNEAKGGGLRRVDASRRQVNRFIRARTRLNRVLYVAGERSSPRLSDWSQVRRLWILTRGSKGARTIHAVEIVAHLECRFE